MAVVWCAVVVVIVVAVFGETMIMMILMTSFSRLALFRLYNMVMETLSLVA